MSSFTSDPNYSERARLAAEPNLPPWAKDRALNPAMPIEEARKMIAAHREVEKAKAALAAAKRAKALDLSDEKQALAIAAGAAHVEPGDPVHTPWSTTFAPLRVVMH